MSLFWQGLLGLVQDPGNPPRKYTVESRLLVFCVWKSYSYNDHAAGVFGTLGETKLVKVIS